MGRRGVIAEKTTREISMNLLNIESSCIIAKFMTIKYMYIGITIYVLIGVAERGRCIYSYL